MLHDAGCIIVGVSDVKGGVHNPRGLSPAGLRAHEQKTGSIVGFEGGETVANDELLELYAFYKQATVGDVSGSRPGMLDLKGRAKYDAWSKKKGVSKDDAMTKYVALVDRLTASR